MIEGDSADGLKGLEHGPLRFFDPTWATPLSVTLNAVMIAVVVTLVALALRLFVNWLGDRRAILGELEDGHEPEAQGDEPGAITKEDRG